MHRCQNGIKSIPFLLPNLKKRKKGKSWPLDWEEGVLRHQLLCVCPLRTGRCALESEEQLKAKDNVIPASLADSSSSSRSSSSSFPSPQEAAADTTKDTQLSTVLYSYSAVQSAAQLLLPSRLRGLDLQRQSVWRQQRAAGATRHWRLPRSGCICWGGVSCLATTNSFPLSPFPRADPSLYVPPNPYLEPIVTQHCKAYIGLVIFSFGCWGVSFLSSV